MPMRRTGLASSPAQQPIGLPGLSEPETVRHYTRLSRQNYAIDLGLFPLGSCTMKHNPRLNEKVARMPGFADVHPLQPVDTVQGALGVIDELAHWLIELTGMHAVAMSPKAGAHGELCGILCIRAALEARGDARKVVLVPESAHGTNPATAAFAGYEVEDIPARQGRPRRSRGAEGAARPRCGGGDDHQPQHLRPVRARHEGDLRRGPCRGRLRLLRRREFQRHRRPGAPGDLGVDAMHINLHKTFSTPHGGGGPGSGPVVLSEALAPFAPLPFVAQGRGQRRDPPGRGRERGDESPGSFGRMTAFHGQMGMFTRALTYILSHGADGLRQVVGRCGAQRQLHAAQPRRRARRAVRRRGPCMHEALFSDKGFAEGISTLDLAKGLIDEGFHPMTMYFPLVVHGAMLVEPTETESKAALDQFIIAMRSLAERAKAGDETLKTAPHHAPRARLDEAQAARKPVLAWQGDRES